MAWTADNQAKLLAENSQGLLFNAESVAANAKSVAFQMARTPMRSYPWGFAIEVASVQSLGTFEIDVQGAEVDLDTHYTLIGTAISTATGSGPYIARFDSVSLYPKFVRIFVKTLTGSVTMTAIITR